MLPKKDRKPWHASISPTLELERNDAAFLWWVLSLGIVHARPDFELGAIFLPAKDRSTHPTASTRSFLITNNLRLCVLEPLNFKKAVATHDLVLRFRVFDHYAFTFASQDCIHQLN